MCARRVDCESCNELLEEVPVLPAGDDNGGALIAGEELDASGGEGEIEYGDADVTKFEFDPTERE